MTNQERLQQNNEKIEAIQQALVGKSGGAGGAGGLSVKREVFSGSFSDLYNRLTELGDKIFKISVLFDVYNDSLINETNLNIRFDSNGTLVKNSATSQTSRITDTLLDLYPSTPTSFYTGYKGYDVYLQITNMEMVLQRYGYSISSSSIAMASGMKTFDDLDVPTFLDGKLTIYYYE